ncbi:hypothetical protein GSI_09862 [Ganoderma sinense ZZ0214-1]|uniref:Uncharacterized protein n=1 Tax=Ganoderma sinense ZZ0214-1 TaxID=1077348 RepID=A0A2G8S2N4_9APHY|nr:hypothetical protein GSI_09862 [Ganoderma sinense ZZ0214-1]
MAPHRALTVPDILREIFEKLSIRPQLSLPGAELGSFQFPNATGDPDDFQASKVNRWTLACAARTCKMFVEPASGVLWEVVDDFAPIESTLKIAHARIWKRIEQIARRIRALSCRAQMGGDADALAAFSSRYDSGRAIFPNMRVFSAVPMWKVDGAAWHSFLRAACASPSLALFTVATDHDGTILKILATAAPAPQKLIHLKAPYLWSIDEEGHRALAKFSNLCTAHFMVIDITLFRHLRLVSCLPSWHAAKESGRRRISELDADAAILGRGIGECFFTALCTGVEGGETVGLGIPEGEGPKPEARWRQSYHLNRPRNRPASVDENLVDTGSAGEVLERV